jgi:hypothetical protein
LCQRIVIAGDPIGRVTVLAFHASDSVVNAAEDGWAWSRMLAQMASGDGDSVRAAGFGHAGAEFVAKQQGKGRKKWSDTPASLVYHSVGRAKGVRQPIAGRRLISGEIGCNVMVVVERRAANCARKQASTNREWQKHSFGG